jgi:hypothetical protein
MCLDGTEYREMLILFITWMHIMFGGWIKSHRKSMESAVWSPNLFFVWSWCLFKASTEDRWVSIKTGRGTTPIQIMRGQFVFGRFEASRELDDVAPTTVRDNMKKLVALGNIVMQSATHYSLVTVCNYDTYQNGDSDDRQTNRQPTANQPPTNRHSIRIKELKKGENREPPFLSIEDLIAELPGDPE